MKTIEERLEAGSPVETELPQLKNKMSQFVDLMKQLLSLADVQMYRDEVRLFETPRCLNLFWGGHTFSLMVSSLLQAYITLCDLLVLFSNQLGQATHNSLEQLVYDADRDLQLMLNDFIQTYVFIDEDEGKTFNYPFPTPNMLHLRYFC